MVVVVSCYWNRAKKTHSLYKFHIQMCWQQDLGFYYFLYAGAFPLYIKGLIDQVGGLLELLTTWKLQGTNWESVIMMTWVLTKAEPLSPWLSIWAEPWASSSKPLGTYPVAQNRNMESGRISIFKRVVEGLGYVPVVCWNFLMAIILLFVWDMPLALVSLRYFDWN